MAATSEQRYATEATASLASIVLYVGVLMILEILSMRLPGGENRRLHSAGKFTGTTLHPTLSQINPKRQVFESFSCEFRVCRNDDLPPTGLSERRTTIMTNRKIDRLCLRKMLNSVSRGFSSGVKIPVGSWAHQEWLLIFATISIRVMVIFPHSRA